jgi:hypothetical protein
MRRLLLLAAVTLIRCAAQQTVAPSQEPVGSARGENLGGYNVQNSFETGYRFLSVGGDYGKYRSDVNFGNGLRLLGASLRINSREGHGFLFDEIVLSAQGLGNDPYQSSSLRVQKNRLYRYDLLWRENDYVNPALTIANGLHVMDTKHRLQDHDLTLFPQSAIKFFGGYTRNVQDGPALSTVQEFDSLGDEFPLFAQVHRMRNEYRFGNEINLAGVRFTWTRGWDNFSETTPYALTSPSQGANPSDRVILNQFQRTEPYRGSTPYWRANLHAERKVWAADGRFSYAGGRRDFVFDEAAIGTDRFNPARNRQILIAGNGTRPASAADLTISVFPVERVTITNQTSFNNIRMNGNSFYQQFDNSTFSFNQLNFQFLGIRTFTNSTDALLQVSQRLSFQSGYHFADRLIRSVETAQSGGGLQSLNAEQTNRLHSGVFGIRLRPSKPLSVNLDAEIGRADRPFFPISERNYHALGARLRYKLRTLTLSASARSNYNLNSVSLSSFSSKGRNYSADASWAPRDWLGIDASYAKIHLDTASGIAYFALGQLYSGDRSIYISNIHSGTLMARFGLGKRADFFAGYSRVQDTGDGRSTPLGTIGGASFPVFLAAQTFPLSFESPLARFSLKLHAKIRWNLGYQFYRYHEEFLAQQNYRAHTGYTSLLWSF